MNEHSQNDGNGALVEVDGVEKVFHRGAEEIHVLYPEGGAPRRVIVCGLGEVKNLTAQGMDKALGRGVRRAQDLKSQDAAVVLETVRRARAAPHAEG